MVSPFVQPNAARACSNAALRATVSTSPGASWPTTTMRRFAPDRCARAAIGQAAAPPIKVTNSRRFIRPTSSAVMNRGRACSPVLPTERIAYLGRGVRLLRCGISNQLMSQMGPAALCGAPWRQPRNPARDVGPEILVRGPKPLSKHRLLVRQDKGVEGEPHEPAVSHETPVAEQDRLAQNDGDDGNVDGIAHVAIQARHHK